MKKTEVIFNLKTGKQLKMNIPVYEIKDDRHKFEMIDSPCLYIFKHNQQHTRLDLSNLKEVLLYSFDKHSSLVGITYCNQTVKGPYEVHNKQRVFLLLKEFIDLVEVNSLNNLC